MPQRGDTLRLLQIVRATKDETLSDCEKLSVVSYSMLASTTLEANKSIQPYAFPHTKKGQRDARHDPGENSPPEWGSL
jgi:hypothetical protein